ncbi:MAG: hypothetical protein JNK82_37620 [Myxococcaceae bacterium]|nr:hypothetical protein [Myxococcaceae bacterium]
MVLTGSGQQVLQNGVAGTPSELAAWIAPGAAHSNVPGGHWQLLDTVRAGNAMSPAMTYVVPSVVLGFGDTAEARQLLADLQAAGAIVVGTSTPVGAAGQPTIGTPTVRVDTYEHSTVDSIVANAIVPRGRIQPLFERSVGCWQRPARTDRLGGVNEAAGDAGAPAPVPMPSLRSLR